MPNSTDAAPNDPLFPGDPIYVIEPHADDAFLSIGWSIRMWVNAGRAVEIVTVYSDDRQRSEEAAAWAASVGAGWSGLGLKECGADAFANAPDLEVALPVPLLPDYIGAATACRIWPLGLRHPEHVAVARAALHGDLHYVDTPYQLHLFDQRALRSALVGRTITWWQRPPKRKWDASRFFASQHILFETWSPEVLQSCAEVVVR